MPMAWYVPVVCFVKSLRALGREPTAGNTSPRDTGEYRRIAHTPMRESTTSASARREDAVATSIHAGPGVWPCAAQPPPHGHIYRYSETRERTRDE